MPKRKISDERCGDCAVKRPALQPKQHLYLLLDDWERGYSVRRLDVDAFDSDAGIDLPPKRFTEPPVARIEAEHVGDSTFVSHGTKILAMQPGEASPAIPAFDTRTLGLGQAYFDAELEAWVGLCGERDGAGRLCSCDVTPIAAEYTRPPSWKLGKDKLFRKDPELHLAGRQACLLATAGSASLSFCSTRTTSICAARSMWMRTIARPGAGSCFV
ncbi:hypothetical protein BAE44_0005321 [Dichanthelium oligosanthes]|uniref:Uncharacterized protein n=1 Tax=Dichanthelium oligosanthes TaxID=888268 RepID=A0A1E5W8F0_9POAL|nr:hypothetical protein BAE44_0005321 [Dichanthelium oligosanthes]